jgi:hypothetical protein
MKSAIINIRGTSGSGKSTLVRRVIELYVNHPGYDVNMGRECHHADGRKQPIGYTYRCEGLPDLLLVGHYETACGGCDTITSMETIYQIVREMNTDTAPPNGRLTIFEGLLISAEIRRAHELSQFGQEFGSKFTVLALTTPVDLCVESVNMRRHAKNPEKPGVNPKNTISKFKGVQSSVRALREKGVDCREVSRDEALEQVKEIMGVLGV